MHSPTVFTSTLHVASV